MPVQPAASKKANIWQTLVENWRNKLELAREQMRFLKYERDFGERDSDIYIVSFPRSGTTLLQVIVYHLTHPGGMDYNHIYDVSPWLRDLSVNKLPLPQIQSPRVIKTHDPYALIHPGKKGKFIFVLRDAADAVVSNYHHWKNYNDPDLAIDEVFEKLMRTHATIGYFDFNRKWMENKKALPVLYLRYEDVLANKKEAINNISAFLNVSMDERKINDVLELSSFSNMKHNENRFGEQPKEKLDARIYNQFIRHGIPGEGKTLLSADQLQYCRENYEKLLRTIAWDLGKDALRS